MKSFKVSRFWFTYFIIRLCYLFFTFFIYAKLTILGDTERFLNSGLTFSLKSLYSSTAFMDTIGGGVGYVLGGYNIISNLPFMLISFFVIKWAIDSLSFRRKINEVFLLFVLSLPNFCIWTSVCSKEIFGLLFSAVLGVLLIHFLSGNYKITKKDLFASYLCLLFKPQYYPFIVQALLLIYFLNKPNKSKIYRTRVGGIFLITNLFVLYLIKDIVNEYADIISMHFMSFDGASNRNEDIWLCNNDFFRKAPIGMFIAFFGPTLNEMLTKFTHFLAGIESLVIIGIFFWMSKNIFFRFLATWRINLLISFPYFIVITGICFLHYPFGIFNSGSAIRYRTNFIFLFILLFLYLYSYYGKNRIANK